MLAEQPKKTNRNVLVHVFHVVDGRCDGRISLHHQEISAIAEGLCGRAHNTESVVCLPSRFMVFKQLYLCMLVTCLFRRTEKGILKAVE